MSNLQSINLGQWASLEIDALNDPMFYSIEKLSNDFNIPDLFGQPFSFDVCNTGSD